MSSRVKEYPFYLKSTIILFGLVLICLALFSLKAILAPLAFSLIVAILLNPVVNKLQQWGMHKVVAISISLLLAAIIVGAILFFITTQVINFGDNLPQLKVKFNEQFSQLQHWLSDTFKYSLQKQRADMKELVNSSKTLLGGALGTALGTIGVIFLVPIFVFLLLFYKTLTLNFFHEVFEEENADKVSEILAETKSAIQSYTVGLMLEAIAVAVLDAAALLILGVDYAILLGVLGGLLNMLPYIGGVVAIALPVIIATVTHDGFTTQLLIIGAYTLIQFIDNNFLVPLLVSSRVQINAFFSIVIVLMGGALWGVAGMFLSIPFLAILKIIFDRLPETKPWGKLLGDEIPTRPKREIWGGKMKKAEVQESDDAVEK